MSLKKHFKKIIKAKLKSGENGLHQLIIGPAHTGKTEAAFEYASMLKDSGAVSGDVVYINAQHMREILENNTEKGFSYLERTFNAASGGTIIFDACADDKPTNNSDIYLLARLKIAMAQEKTTIIGVGDEKFLAKINQDPPLAQRLASYVLQTEKNAAPKIAPRS